MGEYEIPLPMADELAKKPILNAYEVHRAIEKAGIRVLSVVVDNANARIRVYTEDVLNDSRKKLLFEVVEEFYRKWIGIEKAR